MSIFQGIRTFLKWRRAASFYTNLIPAGALCYDIGANIGDKSAVLLNIGMKVVAFEPQTSAFDLLTKRLGRRDRMTIVKKGLSDQAGTATLHLCNHHEVSTSSKEFMEAYQKHDYLHWTSSEEIEVVTLDSQIESYSLPFFCKIDVEGMELNVLSGLQTPIPLFEFEFNLPLIEKAVACVTRISTLGDYRFNFSTYENFQLELDSFLPYEEFVLAFKEQTKNSLTGDVYAKLNDL